MPSPIRQWIQLVLSAIRGDETDFISGSIRRSIILLSIPMILEMVMESLFAITDAFFVSRIGVDALAVVGLTESVLTLLYSLSFGLANAATAVVSRRCGEKEYEQAYVAAIQSLWLALLLCLLVSGFSLFYSDDILGWLGAGESLKREGLGYVRWMLISSPAIVFLFVLNGIFRGAGHAAISMRSLWIANGLNMILDPCLIFGLFFFPEWGLTGAAIATVIGRSSGVAYQLWILLRGKTLLSQPTFSLPFRPAVLLQILRTSIGGAGQYLIASASWIFLMRIISISGTAALAAYTISIRIIIFSILPCWGIANAAATLVGQNLGAGNPDRAEASVWLAGRYTTIFLLLLALVFGLFARDFIGIFQQDPEVLSLGTVCLQILCVGYLFFGFEMVMSQAFNGAGDTYTPTLLNFIFFWLFQIPLAYVFGISWNLGIQGVSWAIAISEGLLALTLVVLFRRGKWKNVQL